MPLIVPQHHSPTAGTQTSNTSSPDVLQAFGVVDDHFRPIPAAAHYRSGRCLEDTLQLISRAKELDPGAAILAGRWFYGGVFFTHFGHFLTETVHRLRPYLACPGEYDGVLFLKSPVRRSFDYNPLEPDYVVETLERYFGIPLPRIKLIDRPTRVSDLDCLPQQQQLGKTTERGYLRWLGEIEAGYISRIEPPLQEAGQRLFLSRRNFLRGGRALGMTAVERVFASNGFTIMCPEDMPFSEQLHAIHGCRELVAEAGSALHLLDILGPRMGRLVVLSRRGFDKSYWQNLYSTRFPEVKVFDTVLPLHDYTGTHPGVGHSLIHPRQMAGFIKELGIDLDSQEFVADLKRETESDMKELSICLPME